MGGDDGKQQTHGACNSMLLTSLGIQSAKTKMAEPYHILLEWSLMGELNVKKIPLLKKSKKNQLTLLL